MQRREFLQYSAIGATSFLATSSWLGDRSSYAAQVYDWVLLYWMPYNNNLSKYGAPILDMLRRGVQSENILVAVQAKLSGNPQMLRKIITAGKVELPDLPENDSASAEVLEQYLDWARLKFQAKKWAVIILGHGGKLDEISPDEQQEDGSNIVTKWMNLQKLADTVAKFNRQVNGRVELFFFQNCNKSTLEASYTLRNAAKYTLASQLLLGAPNYYYEQALQFLGSNPEIDGGQLAAKIMEFERSDMYHSYTAINNAALPQVSAKIGSLITEILAAHPQAIRLRSLDIYEYAGDRYSDALAFLQLAAKQSGAAIAKYTELENFIKSSVIYSLKTGGTLLGARKKQYQNLSGLGAFIPTNKQDLERYRYLPALQELKLIDLFDSIL